VETYVPLRWVWHRWSDRRKLIQVPALAGYVLVRCRIDPALRAAIKKTPGVVGIVSVDGRPCVIPEEEVGSLRILLESRVDVEQVAPLQTGEKVRIVAGPLTGAVGTLQRLDQHGRRLIVSITHIGLAFSANVHFADAEAVRSS